MNQRDAPVGRRFKHLFLDAEGTIYVPKMGRMPWEFWTSPSPETALEFFDMEEGAKKALETLRGRVDSLCVVSRTTGDILNALLDKFGIRHMFDEVMIDGNKGERIVRYLSKHGLSRRDALMVGDLPRLDIYPVKRLGVEAILVDRPYNGGVDAERIRGISELPSWLKLADIAEDEGRERSYIASLDDFQTAAELKDSSRRPAQKVTKRLIAVQNA